MLMNNSSKRINLLLPFFNFLLNEETTICSDNQKIFWHHLNLKDAIFPILCIDMKFRNGNHFYNQHTNRYRVP